MTSPTVGRKVYYRASEYDKSQGMAASSSNKQPCDATVVYVHSDTCVNLVVFDHNGDMHKRTSVFFRQDGVEIPSPGMSYVEWMPYQVNQAKKQESAT